MNFDQLFLFVEAVATKGRLPGHAVWMPAPEQFQGSVEDYWYMRKSGILGMDNVPPNIRDRIEPYIEDEKKFIAATDLERPPTPEEKARLSSAIMELSKRDSVLGSVISRTPVLYCGPNSYNREGRVIHNKKYRTMAVDPYGTLYVNLGYANLCSFEQLVGVLAHEAMHLTDKHHIRLKGRTPFEYANIATDAFINEQLISDGYEVGYGMGVFAKNKEITLRIMYVKDDLTNDIKEADPREYKITIHMADKTWEQLFDIIKEKMENPKEWEQITFKVGDIVYDKGAKKFGIITATSTSWSGGTSLTIRPLTPEEAKAKSKEKAGFATPPQQTPPQQTPPQQTTEQI